MCLPFLSSLCVASPISSEICYLTHGCLNIFLSPVVQDDVPSHQTEVLPQEPFPLRLQRPRNHRSLHDSHGCHVRVRIRVFSHPYPLSPLIPLALIFWTRYRSGER